MNRRRVAAAVFLVTLASAALASPRDLLRSISAELEVARALPGDAPPKFRCPADLDSLEGVKRSKLEAILGRPDMLWGGSEDAKSGPGWSYIFASRSRPTTEFGGGFAEIIFTFDFAQKKVTRVTCNYAR